MAKLFNPTTASEFETESDAVVAAMSDSLPSTDSDALVRSIHKKLTGTELTVITPETRAELVKVGLTDKPVTYEWVRAQAASGKLELVVQTLIRIWVAIPDDWKAQAWIYIKQSSAKLLRWAADKLHRPEEGELTIPRDPSGRDYRPAPIPGQVPCAQDCVTPTAEEALAKLRKQPCTVSEDYMSLLYSKGRPFGIGEANCDTFLEFLALLFPAKGQDKLHEEVVRRGNMLRGR
jgi:hypothetical protein